MKALVVKTIALALVLALSFALVGCDILASLNSNVATMLVRSSAANTVSISFGSLRGHLSESINNTTEQDGCFLCTASLEEGSVSVYYKTALSDVEQPLFSLGAGESIDAERLGYLTNGEDARIIIYAGESGARGFKMKLEIVN